MKKITFYILIIVGIFWILFSNQNIKAATSLTVNKNAALTGDKTQSDISFGATSASPDQIWNITGNLTLNCSTPACISGFKTGVVFVGGNLNINNNYTYGGTDTTVAPLIGTVFVVKGNVNISQNVTRIDAVIISEDTICTAYSGTACLDGQTITPQLTINGSLISLTESAPIKFRRKLGETGALKDSTDPAEKINHQVKYLVILRDLLSDTYQKWSEIP